MTINRFIKITFYCLFIVLIFLSAADFSVLAQVLRQMDVADVPEGEYPPYLVRNPDEAVLIVHSVIENLSFETNNGGIRQETPTAGEYILHLRPGTHIMRFKADRFMTVQRRFVIPKKTYREVRVQPAGPVGEQAELGTVEFELQPGPVLVVQDGVQIGEFHVGSSGVFRMDLPPGRHKVKLIRFGSDYNETEVDVEVGKTLREVVHFISGDDSQLGVSAQSGVLVVKSDPADATVYVDGARAGNTTLQVREMSAGTHQVRIEKLMYKPLVKRVEITANTVTTISETLVPDFGELSLDSDPTGAGVFVDDKYVGMTPYRVGTISSGLHTIVLKLAHFHDVTWSLRVEPGARIDTAISMPAAFGSLVVTSKPNGASVYLDNQLTGQTPLTRDTVPSGQYVIRIEKELYSTFEATVTVRDNRETLIDTPLDKDFGTLVVSSDPTGMEVKLAGTGMVLGKTPLKRHLSPGMYTILLEHDDYESYIKNISLSLGDTVEIVTGDLVRKTGMLKVFSEPIEADIYLDGESVGKSPLILKEVPTGIHDVIARLPDYADARLQVTVRYNQTEQMNLLLSKSGVTNVTLSKQEFKPFLESTDLSFELDEDARVTITIYNDKKLAIYSAEINGHKGINTCKLNGRCSIACFGTSGLIPNGDYSLEIKQRGRSSSAVFPITVLTNAPLGLLFEDTVTQIPGKSRRPETKRQRKHRDALYWAWGGVAAATLGVVTAITKPGGDDPETQRLRWGTAIGGTIVAIWGFAKYNSTDEYVNVHNASAARHNKKLRKELGSRNAEISRQNKRIKNETVMRFTLGSHD
jgi:hypothetical protein